jgi:cytosine/adenosine deaminase-related metal-dependent hydrolase
VKRRLTGGWVVAWNGADHEVLEGGCVVLDGDRVAFVGFPDDPACPSVDDDLHLPGRLIAPGLINLHCIANVDLQPLRIDVAGVGFPKSRAWFDARTEVLDDAQLETSARFAVATLLRNGATTFANVTTMASKRYDDPAVEPLALARAAADLGARGYVAHNFQDHSRYDDPDGTTHTVPDAARGREGLRRAVAFAERLERDFDDRVRGFLFPYTTETCSDDLLRAARDAAADLGLTLRSHFAQHVSEARDWIAREGLSPVERMDRLGLLGPRTTLTHAIFLRGHPEIGHGDMASDLSLLADSGTSVAHCPVVFSRRGEVLRSFGRYRRAGINLALGTDTAPADLLGEMRMAATLAKVVDEDPLAGSAADVFRAATVGGADALGREDLGRLTPGAKADVSVFDLRTLQLGVIDCPIKALVHYASGADAEHVFVDGAQVVRDRDVVGIDDLGILDAAQALWGTYRERLAARDPQGRSADAMYPSAFPVRRR